MGIQINTQPQVLRTDTVIIGSNSNNLSAVSGLTVYGNISASKPYLGDGSLLTGIKSGVTSVNSLTGDVSGLFFASGGTIGNTTLSANTLLSGVSANFSQTILSRNISATSISAVTLFGDGSKLTGIRGGVSSVNSLTGDITGVAFTSGGIFTGPVRFSSPNALSGSQANFSGNVSAAKFIGDGVSLLNVLPLTGGTITGNLSVGGTFSYANTAIAYSTVVIENSAVTANLSGASVGTALTVIKGYGSGNIASFYDKDNKEVLHIHNPGEIINGSSANTGSIGIGTSTPNKTLTVVGTVSAGEAWFSGINVSSLKINDVDSSVLFGDKSNADAAFTSVQNNSSNWNNTYNSVLNTSSNWDSSYNFLTNGGTVNGNVNVNGGVDATGTVDANQFSINGNNISNIYGSKTTLDNLDYIVNLNKDEWNAAHDFIHDGGTVNGNAFVTGYVDSVGGYKTNGVDISNIYGNKSNTDSVFNTTQANSGKWQNVYNTTFAKSGGWESAVQLRSQGGTIQGNLTVQGNLNVTGTKTETNTVVNTTSAQKIINSGAALGPALYVLQGTGAGAVATFVDSNSATILHVHNPNDLINGNPDYTGSVGIKTSTPNKTLTVAGEISASGDIWTGGKYYGDGSGLSNINASNIVGAGASVNTINGLSGNVTGVFFASGGTIGNTTLSANTILRGVSSFFSNNISSPVVSAQTLYGSGSNITGVVYSINGSNGAISNVVIDNAEINLQNSLKAPSATFASSVSSARLSATNIIGSIATLTTSISSPTINATRFFGDGSGLTGLVATGVSGIKVVNTINGLSGDVTGVYFASGGSITGGLTGTTATFNVSLTSPSISASNYFVGSNNINTLYGSKSLTDTTYNTVNTYSADWNVGKTLSGSGGYGYRFVGNQPRIYGDLTVDRIITLSGATFVNTTFTTTSALCVVNTMGSGAALYVGASGSGDIASFYDTDGNVEVLHIGGHNGFYPNVGIKVSQPNKTLTVSGEISATGDAWFGSNIYSNNVNINTLYGSKSLTDSINSSLTSTSGNWNQSYTALTSTSGRWNTTWNQISGGSLSAASGGFTVLVSLSTPEFTTNSANITSLNAGTILSAGTNLNQIFGKASALSGLTDVRIENLANAQVLKYDSISGLWVNGVDAQGAGQTIALADLIQDVALNNPQPNQALIYGNSTQWVNRNLLISDISNLQNELNGKQPVGSYANSVHNHSFSQITDINIGTTPQSGQTLVYDTANSKWNNATLQIANIQGLNAALAGKQETGNYALSVHQHTTSDITNFNTGVNTVINAAAGSSIVPLVAGKIPTSYFPASVDDIYEYTNYNTLTADTSISAKRADALYLTLSENKIYRWGSTTYVEIVASPGSADAVPEGSVNKYFTNPRAVAAISGVGGLLNTSIFPIMDSAATIGTSVLYARADHVHPTDTTRAPINSPTFTGTPASVTPNSTDNSTRIATTAFVNSFALDKTGLSNTSGTLSGLALRASTDVIAPSATFTNTISAARYLGSASTLTGIVTGVYGLAPNNGNITNVLTSVNGTAPTNGNIGGFAVTTSGNTFVGQNNFTTLTASTLSASTVSISGYPITALTRVYSVGSGSTSTYTVALSDNNNTLTMDVTTSGIISLNSAVNYPQGFQFNVIQLNTGRITLSAGTGVTLNNDLNFFKTYTRYSAATVLNIGSMWVCYGALSS